MKSRVTLGNQRESIGLIKYFNDIEATHFIF